MVIVICLQRLEAGNTAVRGDLTPSRLDKCHIRQRPHFYALSMTSNWLEASQENRQSFNWPQVECRMYFDMLRMPPQL